MPRGVTSFSKKVKKGLGQHDQEPGAVLFFGGEGCGSYGGEDF